MKKRIDLAGEWIMRQDTGEELPGRLPGSNYLTLMDNGMEDPFFGTNEEWATEKGHHGCRFSRSFTLTKEDLAKDHLDFVADGIDTVCEVYINGKSAGKADNINRVWRFDIRPYALEGENRVELDIKDPYAYMLKEQRGDKHLQKRGQEKSFIVGKELEEYYKTFDERSAGRYVSMKPGITGLWQVMKRSDAEDYRERVELDDWYVLHVSLKTDLLIILQTIACMFTGKGAY